VGVWLRLATAESNAAQKAGSSATEVRWPWMVKLRLLKCRIGGQAQQSAKPIELVEPGHCRALPSIG